LITIILNKNSEAKWVSFKFKMKKINFYKA
jgi:hypothetical protein